MFLQEKEMKSAMSTISKVAVMTTIALSQITLGAAKPTSAITDDKEMVTPSFIETFKDIRQKVISDVEKGIIPSVSISVAKDGIVIWQEAFGWADKAQKRAATPETIYSLASLTKPLTATGVMLLAEKGKIDLNESIEKYISPLTLKSYAYDSQKVTVKHLLNHTSGLPTHFNYFYADENARPPSFEETLDRYGFIINEPGTSFKYSNLGYGLLGFTISKISQMPLESFMENEIFVPLGMNRTTFNIESFNKENLATRYDSQGNALPGSQCDTPAAGHAYSTSVDLMRFAFYLLGNEIKGSKSILSKDSIKRMISEHSDSSKNPYEENAYYCLGFFYRQHKAGFTEVWHEGGWDGASSLLKIIPEENVAVVTLINTFNSEYVTEITNKIIAAMVGSYKDEEFTSGPPNRIASKIPDELLGSWKGEIKTYAGPVPIMMNFNQGGHIGVSIGDQNNWSHLYIIDLTDLRIFGSCAGDIPTDDTKRYPHEIRLSIKKEGEKLIGEATAVPRWNQVKQTRMYAALSHYVELIKLND
jgi:CubicO group peptidase (beta-lactamase class C family)